MPVAEASVDAFVVRETRAMDGSHRLRRRTNRWARFAEVGVRLTPAVSAGAVVCADAFGRRLSAVVAGDIDASTEARDGAWYALRELPNDARGFLVEITEIVTAPADTGPGDVKFTTAQAVRRALGHLPSRPPFTGADGNPVFPAGELGDHIP